MVLLVIKGTIVRYIHRYIIVFNLLAKLVIEHRE